MDPLEALQKHLKNPETCPFTEVEYEGTLYYGFGDIAYPAQTLTGLAVYGKKDEYYSLESLMLFNKFKAENHGLYVKEAAAMNVRAVTRIDKKNVSEYLYENKQDFPTISMTEPIPLSSIMKTDEPEPKRIKLEDDLDKQKATLVPKIEVRALNDSLTIDRIAEMRRKRQSHREKGIIAIDESLSQLSGSSLPKVRVHRTRENSMLGTKDLLNVLDIINCASRQWEIDEKKEKVAAIHATAHQNREPNSQQPQRSGYSRYAQEAFAHDKTKDLQTEMSFIGSSLTALKQGTGLKAQEAARPVVKPTAPLTTPGGKRPSRTPIIVVPAAMGQMINMYNAKDILQSLTFVQSDKRRAELSKKPVDLVIQRQKNGQTFNIRVIDSVDRLNNEDWDRVIACFVMGAAWQFKGWKWNGNPTDIFTHIPAFHLYFDNDKPNAQVKNWNVHKIPISFQKRHMDKAKFSQMWETIENFVRKNKPALSSRLGL